MSIFYSFRMPTYLTPVYSSIFFFFVLGRQVAGATHSTHPWKWTWLELFLKPCLSLHRSGMFCGVSCSRLGLWRNRTVLLMLLGSLSLGWLFCWDHTLHFCSAPLLFLLDNEVHPAVDYNRVVFNLEDPAVGERCGAAHPQEVFQNSLCIGVLVVHKGFQDPESHHVGGFYRHPALVRLLLASINPWTLVPVRWFETVGFQGTGWWGFWIRRLALNGRTVFPFPGLRSCHGRNADHRRRVWSLSLLGGPYRIQHGHFFKEQRWQGSQRDRFEFRFSRDFNVQFAEQKRAPPDYRGSRHVSGSLKNSARIQSDSRWFIVFTAQNRISSVLKLYL